MSNVIPFPASKGPQRTGRHVAHRADKFAHPAFRFHRMYRRVDGVPVKVDDYRPKHRGPSFRKL